MDPSDRPAPRADVRLASSSVHSVSPPGLLPALLAAILAGAGSFVWGIPRLMGQSGEIRLDGMPVSSMLSPLTPAEFDGALSTMELSPTDRARVKDRSTCPVLAYVVVRAAPGEGPLRLRLRSGGYYSPVFTVGEQPERVGIPYPTPYHSGHGTLYAFDDGGRGTVALSPPWRVQASASALAREVRWTVHSVCSGGG